MKELPDACRAAQQRPSLSIDWKLSAEYFDDTNLTDDEKREFIQAIWYIMVSFVDLGFDVKSPVRIDTETFYDGHADHTTPTQGQTPTPQRRRS